MGLSSGGIGGRERTMAGSGSGERVCGQPSRIRIEIGRPSPSGRLCQRGCDVTPPPLSDTRSGRSLASFVSLAFCQCPLPDLAPSSILLSSCLLF